MVVLLVVVALGVLGIVRVGRTLAPRQRAVLVMAFICVLAYLVLKLVELGYLGQRHEN